MGTADHDVYKPRRAANLPMFSKRAVYMRAQPVLHEEVEALCGNFEKMRETGEVRDVREVYLAYTSVAASRYFTGSRLEYQENRKILGEWYATTIAIPQVTLILKQFPWSVGLGMKIPRRVVALISARLARLFDLHEVSFSGSNLMYKFLGNHLSSLFGNKPKSLKRAKKDLSMVTTNERISRRLFFTPSGVVFRCPMKKSPSQDFGKRVLTCLLPALKRLRELSPIALTISWRTSHF